MNQYKPVPKVAYGFGSAGLVAVFMAVYQAINTGDWSQFLTVAVPVLLPIVIGFVVAWFKVDPDRAKYLELVKQAINEAEQQPD